MLNALFMVYLSNFIINPVFSCNEYSAVFKIKESNSFEKNKKLKKARGQGRQSKTTFTWCMVAFYS